MNNELLQAAIDLMNWVLIKNDNMMPLDLLDAQHTVKEQWRAQTLEDLRRSERADFNSNLMYVLYGDDRHE
tara:strand:- start:3528 stop:3740 length:213 start_codon:yes stop_codon:yes gene_type:complete